MTTEIQNQQPERSEVPAEVIEKLVLHGDLSGMQPQEKTKYYNGICQSLGLNPLTQPFAITKLNGKEVMYAKKDCAEQLRKIYGVSVTELVKEQVGDIYMITAKGVNRAGRVDSAVGAVSLTGKSGEALANQIMKCETKAKRRLTLSICGLGMLDETEVEDIGIANIEQKSQEQKSMNIDVVEPNEQNMAKYGVIATLARDPRVPEELFTSQGITRESFIEDFGSRFMAGIVTVIEADSVLNKLKEHCI